MFTPYADEAVASGGDLKEKCRHSVLTIAIREGNEAAVSLLLEHGANVTQHIDRCGAEHMRGDSRLISPNELAYNLDREAISELVSQAFRQQRKRKTDSKEEKEARAATAPDGKSNAGLGKAEL
jgi:hypothetical protein